VHPLDAEGAEAIFSPISKFFFMKQKKSSRYTVFLQRPVPNQEITVWKPNQKKRAVGLLKSAKKLNRSRI
jgi:hypothetical protein